MADGTNNIYIESSFFADSNDGETDVLTELYLAEEADNIGSVEIPTVFTVGTPITVANDNIVEFYCSSAALSGTNAISIEYQHTNTAIAGVIDSLVGFYCASNTISGSLSKDVVFTLGDNSVLGENRVNVNIIIGDAYDNTEPIPVFYWNYPGISGSVDKDVDYTLLSPTITSTNKVVDFSLSSLSGVSAGAISKVVDLTFSGWVPNDIDVDVISSLLGQKYIDVESTVISGSVYYNPIDVYSTASGTGYFGSDLLCSLTAYADVGFESTVISGSFRPIYTDLWSVYVGDPYLRAEVEIYPLYFSDFYLDIGDYTTYSGVMSVDVYDDSVYSITLSGTYFKVDGVQVPVTFSGITNGYTMYYDPGETFSNFEGSTTITAHAENSNGDVLEQDFYLTFGYIVSYENYDKINYGFGNRVAVRMVAENNGSCPVSTADSYWFGTEQMTNKDLGAQIVGMPAEGEGSSDISASIYPQSNAYFYGKTFRVVLTANDFDGNEMEPYEFEFEIENPND